MSSVKIIQRTDKARQDGTAPLFIRLTHRRKSRYRSLKVRLVPEHWDQDRQRVKKAHPFSTRLNALLAKKRAEFEELAMELDHHRGNLYQQDLQSLLEGPAGTSFLQRAFGYVEGLFREGRDGTARTYQSTFRQFAHWLKEHKRMADLSFAGLTVPLAREYKIYLETEQGQHPNSVKVKFAALRRIMNLAQREGFITEAQNSLKRILTPGRKTQKAIPSREQMHKIEATVLGPGSRIWHSRNLFLFSARMAGLRFSDAVSLRWRQVQGAHLQWTTRKTGKQMRLLIPDSAWEILNHYRNGSESPESFVFPFLRTGKRREITVANVKCNRDLKAICKLAGLSKSFSFHAARHYFATEALRRGMRVELLKEIMTHSSLEQTMAYVRIVGADLDDAMRKNRISKSGAAR
jgi:integrase/recombinase XerD